MVLGFFSLFLYLLIVVLSTPNLAPANSVRIALTLNWWVIGGVSAGAGIQSFLVAYAKERSCNFRMRGPLTRSTGVFSGLSSFLSFIALVPVGCCGTWLYILSFLPGILGVGTSAFLIRYSTPLALSGLAMMAASVTYTYVSVRSRVRALRRG